MTNPLPIAATFSKDPRFWGKDFYPTELINGAGAYVLDSESKAYLDWVSALGANLLGYGHPEFCYRVMRQITMGIGFTLPHVLERRVAEKLVNVFGNHVPGWTPDGLGVRFSKSGTDATTMAVRLARAVTGRTRIIEVGYHGWADWSISATPPHWGVPVNDSCPEVIDIPFDRIDLLTDALNMVPTAAVILEHPAQVLQEGYYAKLRRQCNASGALLIMDEVVTWPRFGLGGACELYGIEPDIVCIGKGLGNGLPISAMIGHREYFDWFDRNDPVFVSSTHFGDAVGLAAADAVLDIWGQEQVHHIKLIGRLLANGMVDAGYQVVGQPSRSLLQFASLSERAYFILGMRDRGILINRPNLPNLAHTSDDVAKTVRAAKEVKSEMDKIDVQAVMADRLPQVLFEGR